MEDQHQKQLMLLIEKTLSVTSVYEAGREAMAMGDSDSSDSEEIRISNAG